MEFSERLVPTQPCRREHVQPSPHSRLAVSITNQLQQDGLPTAVFSLRKAENSTTTGNIRRGTVSTLWKKRMTNLREALSSVFHAPPPHSLILV